MKRPLDKRSNHIKIDDVTEMHRRPVNMVIMNGPHDVHDATLIKNARVVKDFNEIADGISSQKKRDTEVLKRMIEATEVWKAPVSKGRRKKSTSKKAPKVKL